METLIIFLLAVVIVSVIYYQLQKRIGEDQAAEWQDFVKANPQYFKKPSAPLSKDTNLGWSDDQKKSISNQCGEGT